MQKIIVLITILMIAPNIASAENPSSLEQARGIASQEGKPILIEFFQPDCEVCQLAAKDISSNDSILTAIKSVIYLSLDVSSPEGERLSSAYYVQSDFPVFALTDSAGEIINHWTGYSSTLFFLQSLKQGLTSQITIKARYERLKSFPTLDDAIFLAQYNNEIGDYVKSAELYRQAQDLQKKPAYVYDIFQNTADAVWKENLPFEKLIAAADDVLVTQPGNEIAIAGVARIMGNVARKTGKTSEIAKYLQAAIDISNGRGDKRSQDWNTLFSGDRALYVESDTAKAISIEKNSLGADWENNPGKYFSYAKWCLERKIDLGNAESYASKAVGQAGKGKLMASVLSTLAHIYEARGKTSDAANTMDLAVKQDPGNTWYASEAKRMRGLVDSKK